MKWRAHSCLKDFGTSGSSLLQGRPHPLQRPQRIPVDAL
jgi:hypothetical protein